MPAMPSRRIRRGVLGALCAAAVLSLPACSVLNSSDGAESGGTAAEKSGPFAGLSGPEIAKKAIAANLGASSMTVTSDAEEAGVHTASDVAMNQKGDCTGTQTTDEGTLTLTMIDSVFYQKLDEKSVRSQNKGESASDTDNAVKVLANLWTKEGSDTPEAKDNADFCDLHALLTSLQGAGALARKGAVTTVNGQEAITLTEKDSKGTYTMYVATTGDPYLLKYVVKDAKPSTLGFSDFNKPVPAKVPADKDMVDTSQLES
jgi:hypothetical protein